MNSRHVILSFGALALSASLVAGCVSSEMAQSRHSDEAAQRVLNAAVKSSKRENDVRRAEIALAQEVIRQNNESCFAPKPEDAPGQAPMRRFMELSHEAEYGDGGGGGGGGGGC